MLEIINIINIAVAIILFIAVANTYIKYRHYKRLYGRHYKSLLYKEIYKKYKFMLPDEKSDKYKKLKKRLFDSGWNTSVYKFLAIKIFFFIFGLLFAVSVINTNKNSQINEITRDIYYGKMSNEHKIDKDKKLLKQEENIVLEMRKAVDASKINKENLKEYVDSVKKVIIKEQYTGYESTEIVARRIIQKLVDIKEIEDNIDEYMLVLAICILLYFIPDIACVIRQYLIEDKKHWETVIAIFTYCIFAKIPPYKATVIVDNIIEVTDIYKMTFEKINYALRNGKGEETINEIIKTNDLDEELFELLETIKLTISTGVHKTAESMEMLAQNTIEWQKIKQNNRRNKKYLILIPVLLIIFVLCFDYVMYGLTEIVSSFKLDI